jgi:lycopene elongase/hydratase (dihydrobisanhydrobacterioruberin-forming)
VNDPVMERLAGRAAVSRRRFVDICAIGRPQFWPVSLLPFYVGFVLATHRLAPTGAELPRVIAGGIVAGPLLWLSVLAVNDLHDLPGDLTNPRRANAPLVSGRVSARLARVVCVVSGAAAVLVAPAVGAQFTVGTTLALALGWAYSAPPVRLKTRAGLDVAANAVAIGTLGPIAGWITVHSVTGFPWVLAVQGTLVGVALYVPTTLADYRADLASGFDTIAVRLGARRTYRLGLLAWIASAGWSVLLAATGDVLPHQALYFEVVLVPGLVAAYHWLLHEQATFRRITIISFLFLLPSGLFALTYTHTL